MSSHESSEPLRNRRFGSGAPSSHRRFVRAVRMVGRTLGIGGLALVLALPSTAGGAASASGSEATSPGWAGYIGLGSFPAVTARFVVPAVTCAAGEDSSSMVWAGIGGFRAGTVEQDGVEMACQGGEASYWAWWEESGEPSSSGALPRVSVRPGDTVTATVDDLGGGRYAMTVTDAGSDTAQSASATEPGAADNSIECVAEDPDGTGGQVPYADYGTVTVSACLAGGVGSDAGTVVSGGSPVGAGALVRVTGVTGGNGVDAAVSPMSDGTSFTVTREFPPVYTPPLDRPVVGIAGMPDGAGYWLTNGSGDVSAHGAARTYGSMAGRPLAAPVVDIVSSPTGRGYWLVASDGGVFAFGDAGYHGSMGGRHLVRPVQALAAGPGGHGYWLVASDGGVFAFGAPFDGSMGGSPLRQPVVGLALDPATAGYWLVASDGGVFAFGAPYLGSDGAQVAGSPVVSLEATASGDGYRLVAGGGAVSSFGDAVSHGGLPGDSSGGPVTGTAADAATGGYWLLTADGSVTACDATWFGDF